MSYNNVALQPQCPGTIRRGRNAIPKGRGNHGTCRWIGTSTFNGLCGAIWRYSSQIDDEAALGHPAAIHDPSCRLLCDHLSQNRNAESAIYSAVSKQVAHRLRDRPSIASTYRFCTPTIIQPIKRRVLRRIDQPLPLRNPRHMFRTKLVGKAVSVYKKIKMILV